MCRSVPQMEATFTLTRTSLRPKAGILTSRISAPGAAEMRTGRLLSSLSFEEVRQYSGHDRDPEEVKRASTGFAEKIPAQIADEDRREFYDRDSKRVAPPLILKAALVAFTFARRFSPSLGRIQ